MCEFCLKWPWPINEGTKPELIDEPVPDPEPETTFEPPEVITITCQGLDLEGLFKLVHSGDPASLGHRGADLKIYSRYA